MFSILSRWSGLWTSEERYNLVLSRNKAIDDIKNMAIGGNNDLHLAEDVEIENSLVKLVGRDEVKVTMSTFLARLETWRVEFMK